MRVVYRGIVRVMNIKDAKLIKYVYLVVMFIVFIFYPWWIVIEDFGFRLLVFIFSLVAIFVGYFIMSWVTADIKPKKTRPFLIGLFSRRYIPWLFAGLILIFVVQSFALSFPIEIRGDEGFHVDKGLFLFFALSTVLSKIGSILVFLGLLVAVSLVVFLAQKRIKLLLIGLRDFLCADERRFLSMMFFFVLLFVVSMVYFFITNYFITQVHVAQFGFAEVKPSHFAWLVRFPPLGTIFSAIPYFAGYSIVAVRSLQTLFFFLSAVALFELVSLFRENTVAFLSSLVLLFSPGYFAYGHMAYMEPGLILVIMIACYFFLRYLKDSDPFSGAVSSIVLLVGFFYKDPVLFMFPVFWLVIGWVDFLPNGKRNLLSVLKKHKVFILSNILVLFSIFPWVILAKKYNLLQYSSLWNLEGLLSFSSWTYYPYVMLGHMTPILAALFVVGLVYSFIRFDDILTRLCLVFVVFWYFMFTSYMLDPRLVVPLIAFTAVISSQFVIDLSTKICSRRAFVYSVLFLLVSILFVSSFYATYIRNDDQHYPFDNAYAYISKNIPENSRIYLACWVYKEFYIKKYDIKNPLVKYNDFLSEVPESNLERFHSALVSADVDYILYVSSYDVVPEYLNYSMLRSIGNNVSLFVVENEFLRGDDSLSLAKVVR